jgi:hypothetical protein
VAVRLCQHFERHGVCSRGFKCRFAHRVGPALRELPHPSVLVHIQHTAGGDPSGVDAGGPSATTVSSWRHSHASIPAMEPSRDLSRAATVAGRQIVSTHRGWRHPAYDAQPL